MGKKKLHLDIVEVKVDNNHDLTIGVGPCGGDGGVGGTPSGEIGILGGGSATLGVPGDNSDTCTTQPSIPPRGGGGGSAGGNSGPCM